MLNKRVLLIGMLALAASCLSCGGGSSVAYKQGHKAEERKDWDTALVDYEKAKAADPANSLYVLHEQNARLNAGLLHLKNGRQLLKEGRLDEAAGELQKAARIDPSNQAAAQELDAVLAKQAQAKKAHTQAIQKALKAGQEENQPAAVKLRPLSQEPIVHLRIPSADSKKVFETLGKLAGLNVAFTSDYRPVPLSEDLVGIKQEDALNLVGLQSKSFWKAITPNTILIIPDTDPNRLAYDEQVVKTIYLSNPLAPADRTAITSDLKQVLGLRYIMDNPDANAIIIRDTPAKVAEAEQLVRKLDRAKAEIMIDIDIVEADRDRIRNLGLTPATISSSGSITPGLQAGAAFAPTTTVAGATTTIASAAINHLTYKDYVVVLPGATAQAVLNDSKTHIMQSPQIRVTDGQTAKLKIGTRIPIATGSFLPSLGGTTSSAGGGVGLLASTQFQYQDVGVNLDLTPHLLPTGEVAVHAKIEISSLGAPISVGGLTQPTFGQRIIEDDFRLQEGEVNLLGGLIQRTLTNSVQGIPGLGDIPLVRYLFSQNNKEVNDQEVLVMLTPRVIRLPEPALIEGSAIPAGALGGGEERPGGFEGPRPFEIPNPGPPQPQ
jgi:general secretion pathway protein D